VFIVLFCFPLIPTGTYLVERKRGYARNHFAEAGKVCRTGSLRTKLDS
jgi:hypothetical protein